MEDNMEDNLEKAIMSASVVPTRSELLGKLALPLSILVAAILISGTILYTSRTPSSNNVGDPTATGPIDIKITSADHILGNPKAKVTIVEFADFRCPFCERFFQQTEKQLIEEYVNTGKARLVFKNYAFLGQQSVWASEAVECAAEQGKFWEYHDWLYNNQASEADLAYYSKANLIKYAGKVSGIDSTQFASCLNSDKSLTRVNADLAQGQAAGVDGTPTTFINGQRLVGAQPYAVFKAVIDAALK